MSNKCTKLDKNNIQEIKKKQINLDKEINIIIYKKYKKIQIN